VLVVVESPDSMRACRFEFVCQLKLPHEKKVLLKDSQSKPFKIFFLANPNSKEAEEKDKEVHLMPSSIINPLIAPKSIKEIRSNFYFGLCQFLSSQERSEQILISSLFHPIIPSSERLIPKSH
jgi:hypothetical protein